MEDANGAGLAAPQVHVPLRLFVFRAMPDRASGDERDTPMGNTVVINPEVELLTEERVLRWEGCLSIPGLRAAVEHRDGELVREILFSTNTSVSMDDEVELSGPAEPSADAVPA